MKYLFHVSTCLIALGSATAAIAQETVGTTPTPAPSPAADAPVGLLDIVVTAQRRTENLQKAAIAATAVSGDVLASAGVTKVTELTSLVPALQIVPAAGAYPLFYLRGVGNFAANALSDAAVAFNVDNVYIGRPSSTTGFFYDVDRVEVLNGPQGTLYGRNATGGAINVITHKPDLGVLGGNVSAEYGNYNALRIDGAVNLPLGDTAALRFAATHVRHDGYMKDGTDDQNDIGGRVSLRWDPTENLKVVVVGDYFHQGGKGTGATAQGISDQRAGLFSPQGQAFYASQPNLTIGRLSGPLTFNPRQNNNYWGLSSTIEWTNSLGVLTLIPAHREGRLDSSSGAAGFEIVQKEHDSQTSLEARFATSEEKPLRLLVGGFYFKENNDVPMFAVGQQSLRIMQSYVSKVESVAGFGQVTWAVNPAFRLHIGGRYTSEDKSLNGSLISSLRACVIPSSYFPTYQPGCPSAQMIPFSSPTAPPPNFVPGADGTVTIPGLIDLTGANAKSASFRQSTYRIGANWDVTANNLLYATYETGFKSGGFFFSADRGVYQPEHIKAWTLGSKNRFLGNRLQINAEAFYWKYDDQQISHLAYDSIGNAIIVTENVGKASVKGIEIASQYLIFPNTRLDANVQYLSATYDSFVYTSPNLNGGRGNGTACPNVGVPGQFYTIDCSGRRMPQAPEWTLNLGLQQTFKLPNDARIVGTVRAHYQTETVVGLEFTPVELQDEYWKVDLQLTFRPGHGRYSLSAFANNVFDTTVVAQSFPVPGTLFNADTLRPPRTFGIRADMKF